VSTVIDTRPTPGKPHRYDFPTATRQRFPNGLSLVTVDLPGRPLVSAGLVFRNGAVDEPDALGGATILAARALSEGTERYDAIELVEAAERLGAGLHADASWDAMSAGVEVPADRLGAALELLAELVHRPTFPESEVDRLREERLNDILQARADPRRRAEEAFTETLYTSDSPYRRPASGLAATVEGLDRGALRTAYRRGLDPSRGTFIVTGDLRGLDVPKLVGDLFGSWTAAAEARPPVPITARSAVDRRRVRVIHRPGSVQTELRIGHVGVPRRTPDFHAISVTGAILGGLFNSRLNMKLREEKGYTYGASAGWDLRRGPGPFGARAAVNTEVTVAALTDLLAELDRIRDESVTEQELRAARDYLVGVFPIRFETPGAVLGALAGLFVNELPEDELAGYRERIEAVTVADVRRVANEHIHLDRLAIVLVGDADAFGSELEAANVGPVEIERDPVPAEGPEEGVAEALGPVDRADKAPLPADDDVMDDPAEEEPDGRPA